MLVGYKLINATTNEVIASWGGVWQQNQSIPEMIVLPNGDQVHCPEIEVEYSGFKLIEWNMDEPVPASITRRQCVLQLLALEMITHAEGIAMALSGVAPASIQASIDALPTEDERVRATIDFGSTDYFRNNPLLIAMMEANGSTPESIDQFFIAAAAF